MVDSDPWVEPLSEVGQDCFVVEQVDEGLAMIEGPPERKVALGFVRDLLEVELIDQSVQLVDLIGGQDLPQHHVAVDIEEEPVAVGYGHPDLLTESRPTLKRNRPATNK